ncbi:RluA family pseudouridine synthase [Fontisphaera persica]|uniref:RluA family pseudouridine synthase n=1 Tax=Fontisphaera persica TaxID=2974023 RepID=UPI0024C01FE6|nr:RluA family pseudouridine synthase [Fontisphaera persica]WCJ60751.1 RluA family pseudouridine synthase [Fontisphaera persica]
MNDNVIKLSSRPTREFWEIPILYEDAHLLALSKPARLLTSPDRYDPTRPNLMRLLHEGIRDNKPWARERGLTYLMNAHRLDFETTGILLLAKSKPVLTALATLFGSEKPLKVYVALVQGTPPEPAWQVDAPIAMHPVKTGYWRVDRQNGKRALTRFQVRETFRGYTLLECRPLTGRTHQIRVHLRYCHLPICGDALYGGQPLLLSSLKPNYRLKRGQVERPLIQTVALHAEKLSLPHPVSGQMLEIAAEWPKDLRVAVKYLRQFAPAGGPPASTASFVPEA